MRLGFRTIILVLAVLLSPGLDPQARAEDVIVLKSGRTITGKILNRTAEVLEVEMAVGKSKAKITIKVGDVERIEQGKGLNEEFRKRWSALKPKDVSALESLLQWCLDEGLKTQAVQVRQRIEKEKLALLKDKYPDLWCRPCGATGTLNCAGCEGKGEKIAPCSRCAGNGEIGCRACSRKKEGSLDCRRCGGAGVYERFDPSKGKKVKTRCSTCSGKGKIECPTCKGKQKARCEDCKGKGGTGTECDDCSGKKMLLCQLCEASGVKGNPEKKAPPKLEKDQDKGKEGAPKKDTPEKKPVIKKNPFG